MKKIYGSFFFIFLSTLLFGSFASAQDIDVSRRPLGKNWEYGIRLAMTLGGNAPLSIPDEVNSVEKFTLQPGLAFGFYANRRLNDRWSATVGLRYELKRMKVSARTTHYPIILINPDGDDLQGVWTGYVETDVKNWYLTLPVTASWNATQNWRLQGGLWLSYLVSRSFIGTVYDGYLRKDDPTGERLDIDYARYDFTPDLRRWSWGVELGSAFQLSPHFSLHGDLTFGLNDVFRKDFTVLDFSLYPIYFNIGVEYTF